MHFKTLYREFLFRLVDLELLSPDAQGDASKLLGRLGAMLAFFSVYLGLGGLLFDHKGMPLPAFRAISWTIEHFFISTTMLIVGLFAVLTWDSTFPDRRDVLVLSPLPIRTRTLFFAKIAAVGSGLGLAIGVFNAGPGLIWPITLSSENPGFVDIALPFVHRAFLAYWLTVTAAGVFLFCSVLAVQGIAALLPRRIFLRVSGLLQLAAFCLFVSVYFLEPSLNWPPSGQPPRTWLPDYWFLGVFQQFNGTATPETAALAQRAWIGLAGVAAITASAYGFCYVRVLRRVPEEPDILPSKPMFSWSPRFGTSAETAIVQFALRALGRSRHHRVILSFYLGIGCAILTVLSRAKPPHATAYKPPPPELGLIISSIMILVFWIVGTRVIFTIPLDLRANWIYRVMPVRGGAACVKASRRSLYLMALAPAWVGAAVWFLSHWPWRMASAHLIAFGLMGAILVELCLYNFRKIPFTCSWLPGKANTLFAFSSFSLLLLLQTVKGAMLELDALRDPARCASMIAILAAVAGAARWRTARRANTDEPVVQFDDEQAPVLTGLGLFRDGVLPIRSGP